MKFTKLLPVFVFVLLIVLTYSGYAQVVYVDNNSSKPKSHRKQATLRYWNFNHGSRLKLKDIEDLKIKEQDITRYKYKKKGKRAIETSRVIEKFNENHFKTGYQSFRNGKESSSSVSQYNEENFLIDVKRRYKGRGLRQSTYKYNDLNLLTNVKRFRKGELKSNSFAEYQDTVLLTQYRYHKDTVVPSVKWNYTYYRTGDKKQTEYYKDGEIKRTWVYTCDEEGEEVKSKIETKICELKQYNSDSTYVKIHRTTGKDGKISKRRKTYDKNDRLILVEYINIKNKTTYKEAYAYNKTGKKISTKKYYTGKYADKIRMQSEYTYLNDTIKVALVEQGFEKKTEEIRWAHEYKYNGSGKLLESKRYGKNRELRSTSKHTYNEANQKISIINTDADGALCSKYLSTYNGKGLLSETHSFDKDNLLVHASIIKYQFY